MFTQTRTYENAHHFFGSDHEKRDRGEKMGVNYSTFGSDMPGRTYVNANGKYRYTFNGKEQDTETDLQDYGFRIYNPALGKFLSVDPISYQIPELSPYNFASNSPVLCIDVQGLKGGPTNTGTAPVRTGPVAEPSYSNYTNGNVAPAPGPVFAPGIPAMAYTPSGTPYVSSFVPNYNSSWAKDALACMPAGYDADTWIYAYQRAGGTNLAERYYREAMGQKSMDAAGIHVNAQLTHFLPATDRSTIRWLGSPGQATPQQMKEAYDRYRSGQSYDPQDMALAEQHMAMNGHPLPAGKHIIAETKCMEWFTEPQTFYQSLALREAMGGAPAVAIMGVGTTSPLKDWQGNYTKYSYVRKFTDRAGNLVEQVEIHYIKNNDTGELVDFKFKYTGTFTNR